MKWDNVLETKHDWSRSILGYDEDLFQFNVTATEDVLTTPSVGVKSRMLSVMSVFKRVAA